MGRMVVTGGAGFIGSHVVDRLVQEEHEVVVVDDFSVGREENLSQHARNPRVFVERADVRDLRAMTRLLRGADTVFHLAVQCLRVSLYDPLFVHEVNATGTLITCMAGRDVGVRRFVYVSSSEVYGSAISAPMSEDHPLRPTTPYAASKLAGEMYALSFARTHGLPVIIVRPFNSYGPREHHEGASGELIPRFVIRAMCDVRPTIFGDGEQTRDFTWVPDTALGIVRAAQCDELLGRSVNVACGEEVTVKRVAEIILGTLGRESLGIAHAPDRPGDVRRHFADIGLARRLLDFSPTVSIEEGIRRYVDWLRRTTSDPRALLAEQEHVNWLPEMAATG
jgi:UDP-glucose 4-epimerase